MWHSCPTRIARRYVASFTLMLAALLLPVAVPAAAGEASGPRAYFPAAQPRVLDGSSPQPSAVAGTPAQPVVPLSEDERRYLASLPRLRVQLLTQWAPFSYEGEDGQPTGMLSAYLAYLSETLGLRLDVSSVAEPAESGRLRAAGEIDLNQYVEPAEMADRHLPTRTRPVESYPLVIVGRTDSPAIGDLSELAGFRVAVAAKSVMADLVRAAVPSASIVSAASPEAALEMVRDNKADLYIGNLATLDRAIQSRYVGQLKVVGATKERQLIGFDVRPGLEPLVPLIDRAIEAMPPEQRLAVRNRYLTTTYQFGLSGSEVRRRAAPYVALVITALALLALGYWRQRRQVAIRLQAERELQRAQRLAEEASATKSIFLAGMSHEMRTPLYGMLGTLELLSLTALDDQQRQHIGTIQASSATLLLIIDDLLDYSKFEAGQLDLESMAFDPVELVEGVARAHAPLALRKGLALTCYVQADLPWLIGDPDRIRQTLTNLLTNALKFTSEGHVDIRVFRSPTAPAKPSNESLILEVLDTGIGIAADKQAQLFRPFMQADTETARRFGGTGLGLAICRRFALLMKGGISVESEPGRGSRFSVSLSLESGRPRPPVEATLPNVAVMAREPVWCADVIAMIHQSGGRAIACQGDATDPGTVLLIADETQGPVPNGYAGVVRLEASGPLEAEARPDGLAVSAYHQAGILRALCRAAGIPLTSTASPAQRSMQMSKLDLQVLAVDDHPVNRRLMQQQLEQLGCRTTLVSSGEDALLACRQGQFDAVLTDVHMPGMDGYALAHALRADGFTIPIIGVTASVVTGEAERCVASGMNGHLTKPVLLQALADSLRQVLPDRSEALATAVRSAAERPQSDVSQDDRMLLIRTVWEDAQAIRQAVEQRNLGAVAERAHRVRGAVAHLHDWEEVADLCRELEAVARDAFDAAKQLADDLDGYLQVYLEAES
ncbi:ATP-binding protein [Cupriavidus metallidurans]|nr:MULTISPECIES: ATP-binding protein [unclassified Cupriavidus]